MSFQDCVMGDFNVPVSSVELKMDNINTRAFITVQEYDASYRIVTYTKKGKYLLAMFTYFPRSGINYEDPIEYSKEEIAIATETAKNLLKTFELK